MLNLTKIQREILKKMLFFFTKIYVFFSNICYNKLCKVNNKGEETA